MENKVSSNDKKIALSKTIDWISLKNKKKLLIIACSDTKKSGGIPVCTDNLFLDLNQIRDILINIIYLMNLNISRKKGVGYLLI